MKDLFLVSVLLVSTCYAAIGGVSAVGAVQIGNVDIVRAVAVNWIPNPPPLARAIDIKAVAAIRTPTLAAIDAVRFILNTYNDVGIFFQYFAAAVRAPPGGTLMNPATDGAVADFALYVKKVAIFEYLDNDGVDGFQNGGSDNITGIYFLGHPEVRWKAVVYTNNTITVGNRTVTVHILTWETLDGVFYIRLYVAEAPVTVNGHRLDTNRIKLDVGTRWFDNNNHVRTNYTTGPSARTNARVGIIAIHAAYGAVAFAHLNNTGGAAPSQVSYSSAKFAAAFDYLNTADATTNAGTVTATAALRVHVVDVTNAGQFNVFAAQGWVVKVAFYSFHGVDRPSEIFWDPQVGGSPNPPVDTNQPNPSTTPRNGAAQQSVAVLAAALLLLFSLMF